MTGSQMLHVVWLGVLTLLRVVAMSILATLIWTPIGVWIGLRPRVARIAQPLAQIAASFPVNMTFPFMVAFFIFAHIPINWGSILLMALGTQWYILFNVIAGAMAIPTDLREAAAMFGLHRWQLWKTLIIPAIFPFWVTGALTATGGAWNASIVAEVATWGKDKLVADGLGCVHRRSHRKRVTSRRFISVSWSWRCSSSSSIASSGGASTTWRNGSSSSIDRAKTKRGGALGAAGGACRRGAAHVGGVA